MSFLSSLGKDVKAVFGWLGSPKAHALVVTGEAMIESIYPPADAIINLANTWMSEIVKTEALAAAAGAQTGSGVQKASMTISAVTPQVLSFAKEQGLATPTAETIAKASDALVAFLNAFGETNAVGTAIVPVSGSAA